MAFSFSAPTITDLSVRPGSYQTIADDEDVGGDNMPRIRAANGKKFQFDAFIEPDGNTTGLTQANIITMLTSIASWTIGTTDSSIGTSGTVTGIIESINISGTSAQVATIVVAS